MFFTSSTVTLMSVTISMFSLIIHNISKIFEMFSHQDIHGPIFLKALGLLQIQSLERIILYNPCFHTPVILVSWCRSGKGLFKYYSLNVPVQTWTIDVAFLWLLNVLEFCLLFPREVRALRSSAQYFLVMLELSGVLLYPCSASVH